MRTKDLVAVIHGSHLYGMANPSSDIDHYVVYDFLNKTWRSKRQTTHKITGNKDFTRISLEKFTGQCYTGVPQALETLFSHPAQWVEYHSDWIDISDELRSRITTETNINKILSTYKRTATNFAREDDFKKNRHALRLCINAKQLKECRWMSPNLDYREIENINTYAMLPYEHRMSIFKSEYFDVFDDIK